MASLQAGLIIQCSLSIGSSKTTERREVACSDSLITICIMGRTGRIQVYRRDKSRIFPFHHGAFRASKENLFYQPIRVVIREKTGLCGKNSQATDPPPAPQFGKPLLSKKSWVYFSF